MSPGHRFPLEECVRDTHRRVCPGRPSKVSVSGTPIAPDGTAMGAGRLWARCFGVSGTAIGQSGATILTAWPLGSALTPTTLGMRAWDTHSVRAWDTHSVEAGRSGRTHPGRDILSIHTGEPGMDRILAMRVDPQAVPSSLHGHRPRNNRLGSLTLLGIFCAKGRGTSVHLPDFRVSVEHPLALGNCGSRTRHLAGVESVSRANQAAVLSRMSHSSRRSRFSRLILCISVHSSVRRSAAPRRRPPAEPG